jgi:hypothetical protein
VSGWGSGFRERPSRRAAAVPEVRCRRDDAHRPIAAVQTLANSHTPRSCCLQPCTGHQWRRDARKHLPCQAAIAKAAHPDTAAALQPATQNGNRGRHRRLRSPQQGLASRSGHAARTLYARQWGHSAPTRESTRSDARPCKTTALAGGCDATTGSRGGTRAIASGRPWRSPCSRSEKGLRYPGKVSRLGGSVGVVSICRVG